MTKQYDVVVLGSGNAGMAAAGLARAAGKTVAVVESRDVGGTCPIRGCVPKKVLVAAAQTLHQIDRASEHHIAVEDAKLDWPKLMARERTFVDGVSDDFANSLESRGIDLIEGAAQFIGSDRIAVGGTTLQANKIAIATGSKPRPLPIPGAEHLITSDDILEMTSLPDSLIFIGGGVIAFELAHVLARAGTDVTILEAMPRILPNLDADLIARLHTESERIGIHIVTDVAVKEIAPDGNQLRVSVNSVGRPADFSADRVVNGAGRIPDVDALDLDAANIEHDGTRIIVDEYLRSVSNPNVFVAGDALSGTAQLSALATYEGKQVGKSIVNGALHAPDYRVVPAAVYTVPALASVGLTEAEATEQGLSFSVNSNDMTEWRSARTHAETVAYAKILVDDDSDNILGAHLIGHGAEEIVHLFAFAIKHGVTAGEIADTVYAYPTFASDIKFLV